MTTALTFELGDTTGAPGPNSLIQVDKVLSEVNHRLYRQHMSYTCRVDLNTDANFSLVEVYALAPTWYVMNSLREAKRVHDDAMKEERALAGQARWYDFRINPNFAGTVTSLGAYGLDRNAAVDVVDTTGSEYQYSAIRDSGGGNKGFNLLGVSTSSAYSVFAEYDAMGNVSDSPETAPPGGYDGANADIESENIAVLQGRGNAPPYATDSWNVVWVKVGELYQTAGGSSSKSTGFFEAPLGLIYLPNHAATSTNISLRVKAGKYKGVHAEAL
jgi:hypothetical protein